MTEIILEFHEIKRIHDYLNISSKKNDTTTPKIKSIIHSMEQSKNPVCKIIVEEKHSTNHHTIVAFLKECKLNDWDLDSDDIEHILKGECDYVRDSNTLIPDEETNKILGDES